MSALGLLELDSIATGIRVGDAMVKRAPVEEIVTGTVHPGKYLVMVEGDVASVEEAMAAGRELGFASLLDEIFLPDPHPHIYGAFRGRQRPNTGEALGVVELRTVAALLGAADRGLKGAQVTLRELRVADDLGGKSYCLFQGALHDVEEAVELAVNGLRSPDLLAGQVVIPQIHDEMHENLTAQEFKNRLRAGIT